MKELIKLEDFKCRTCDECKKGMNEGYCIGGGEEYYCSDECLHKHYTPKEWKKMYNDTNKDFEFEGNYWTEWDIEEEYKEYLEDKFDCCLWNQIIINDKKKLGTLEKLTFPIVEVLLKNE